MLKTLKSTFNKLLKNKYTFYIVVLLALVLYAVLRYFNLYEAMTPKKEPMEDKEEEEEETTPLPLNLLLLLLRSAPVPLFLPVSNLNL